MKWRLALFSLSFLLGTTGKLGSKEQQFSCQLGYVDWHDAIVYNKPTGLDFSNPDMLLGVAKTIGCISTKDHTVIIISGFADGSPTEVTFIPQQWVIHITYLQEPEK